MKLVRLTTLTIAVTIAASIAGLAQIEKTAGAIESQPIIDKVPIQIVSHKIGLDYYPMLDRPSLTAPQMNAESGDIPLTENERLARQQRPRNNKNVSAPVAPEDIKARGKLRSYTLVIDDAQVVQVTIRNIETKAVKSVDWDFAFPRYEGGQLLARYDVSSKAEIKPGGKKTLKYTLPAGAKKCEVVTVVSNEKQPEKTDTFEAVCGKGFQDPSLLKQQQETISIKRIEYTDGSVWQRQQ